MSRFEPPEQCTVVSVTPVPLARDSRTLKQAMALARFGYRSIVIADCQRWDLTSSHLPQAMTSLATEGTTSRSGWVHKVWKWIHATNLPAVIQFPFFLAWLMVFTYRYIWRVASRLPKASLYCLHEFSSFPAVWFAMRRVRTPMIYDAHDFYTRIEEEDQLSSFERRFIIPFQRLVERACVERASIVLTVSERLAELIQGQYGVKPIVIRNCHDPSLDRDHIDDIRSRLKLCKEDFLVVTVGNCKKGQMVASALEAMMHLPPRVHLALVGSGYEIHEQDIHGRGLGERVHLVGFIPPTDLVPSIRTADASLILYYGRSDNYKAALPNGFFQSVAAELPILYSDLPEIASVMRANGIGICIDPFDAVSIASAIQRLMNDPDAGGSPVKRHQMNDRYSWKNEEHVYLSVINQVFDSNRPCATQN